MEMCRHDTTSAAEFPFIYWLHDYLNGKKVYQKDASDDFGGIYQVFEVFDI
jgi:hypothetical protein